MFHLQKHEKMFCIKFKNNKRSCNLSVSREKLFPSSVEANVNGLVKTLKVVSQKFKGHGLIPNQNQSELHRPEASRNSTKLH